MFRNITDYYERNVLLICSSELCNLEKTFDDDNTENKIVFYDSFKKFTQKNLILLSKKFEMIKFLIKCNEINYLSGEFVEIVAGSVIKQMLNDDFFKNDKNFTNLLFKEYYINNLNFSIMKILINSNLIDLLENIKDINSEICARLYIDENNYMDIDGIAKDELSFLKIKINNIFEYSFIISCISNKVYFISRMLIHYKEYLSNEFLHSLFTVILILLPNNKCIELIKQSVTYNPDEKTLYCLINTLTISKYFNTFREIISKNDIPIYEYKFKVVKENSNPLNIFKIDCSHINLEYICNEIVEYLLINELLIFENNNDNDLIYSNVYSLIGYCYIFEKNEELGAKEKIQGKDMDFCVDSIKNLSQEIINYDYENILINRLRNTNKCEKIIDEVLNLYLRKYKNYIGRTSNYVWYLNNPVLRNTSTIIEIEVLESIKKKVIKESFDNGPIILSEIIINLIASSRLNPQESECNICTNEKTLLIFSCNHQICLYCVYKHSLNKLKDGLDVNCPICRKLWGLALKVEFEFDFLKNLIV